MEYAKIKIGAVECLCDTSKIYINSMENVLNYFHWIFIRKFKLITELKWILKVWGICI